MNQIKWDRRVRRYWDVGEQNIFTLSKDKCLKLLHALVVCDGQIHDTHSMSFEHTTGELIQGMKLHQADVLFRISLPIGAEETFDKIMGPGWLEEPPVIVAN